MYIMDNLYVLGVCLTLGGLCIYNRTPLLENVNFYYKKSNNYLKNMYPLKILNIITLNDKKIYDINLLGRRFIVDNTDIDLDSYIRLKSSLAIPHTPDDILDATITYNDGTTDDITDTAKLLIGPHLDQFIPDNRSWIINYLNSEYNYSNIKTINIQFINMEEITI